MDEKITKKFTAEEVRALAARLLEENNPGDQAEIDAGLMLIAYADTLSQPADSGRVDANCMDVLRRLRDMLPTVGICGWPAGVSALDEAISTLAAQGQGDRLPAELDAWLQERGLVPDLGEDGSFDMSDLIVALNDHENALMASRPAPPASPAGVPDGLLEHLREALRRVENGHSPRRIPANPGDVDLALSEAIAWLEGRPAPFWVKPAAAPSAPEGDGGWK